MISKTKVVVTIGPSTASYEQLKKVIKNGADVLRLNLSHASYSFCQEIIEQVNILNQELNTSVAIMIDLMGPEIRTSKFSSSQVFLREGDKINLVLDEVIGDNSKFSINYPNLINEVDFNDTLLLNDGLISLKVIDKNMNGLVLEVLNEGFIHDYSKIIIKDKDLKIPFLTPKDKDDILFAHKMNVDFLSLSHVKNANDVKSVLTILNEVNNKHINIISKIENEDAVNNIEEIIEYSDAINVARGDLGVMLDFERIPGIQKKIINLCHEQETVCLVSTELMSTMEHSLRPTRAEVSDVANAILDGVDGVILSGETTIGKFPIETLIMLEKIINATEKDMLYKTAMPKTQDITTIIAKNVVNTVNELDCLAIIAPTMSGYTAKKMSNFRPRCPIIAVSPNIETIKSLQLHFAVNPVLIKELNDLDKIIDVSKDITTKLLDAKQGDKIVITGGYPFKDIKITNFMNIEEL